VKREGRKIPAFLTAARDYIERYALDIVGLFRLRGKDSEMIQIKAYVDHGKIYLLLHPPFSLSYLQT